MSKSRGNVVNPDDYIDSYGADSLRMYEMFMGPLADMKPWSANGIEGPHRFLRKVWRLIVDAQGEISDRIRDEDETVATLKILNQTIKKVSSDIESFGYNTAISQLMILVNELQKTETIAKSTIKALVQMIAPFAPHLAEELWELLGETASVAYAKWPEPIEIPEAEDSVKVIFQVNGKLRGEGMFSKTATKEEVEAAVLASERVQSATEGKTVVKAIYVPGKIFNLVVK
ncbi:MAG: class I tRNA ligase family protein [Opitutales bacterium]|nr:class I tRNA ligase family protein [Opitutales bacterium]